MTRRMGEDDQRPLNMGGAAAGTGRVGRAREIVDDNEMGDVGLDRSHIRRAHAFERNSDRMRCARR